MYTINKDNFPYVIITLSDYTSYQELDTFFKDWLDLYEQKKDFFFIIDSINLCGNNLPYIFKVKEFTSKLKKLPKQFLKSTLIIVYSSVINYTINMYFSIANPLAKIHSYTISDTNQSIDYIDLFNKIENGEIDNVNTVYPSNK